MVKVVGRSCDGASMMVGCRYGVSAIMKCEQPSLLTIHCMAHRLELSLKDCFKTVKTVDKAVNTLVTGLYLFYHNSPLNRSMLKRAHEALRTEGDEPLKMPTRGGGTRWIGHLVTAIENLLQSYLYVDSSPRLQSECQGTRRPKRRHSRNIIFLKNTTCLFNFPLDVLYPLRRMSSQLQERFCSVASSIVSLRPHW
jgi:hypothetical protein